MSVALRGLMALSLVVSAAACSKSSSGGPTSPTGPGGSAASSGTWTGTLVRPGGQPAMTVTWQVTVVTTPDDGLIGPMTLTNGANSVTVNAKGNLGGNNSQGYTVFLQLTSNAGDNPAFPTCTVTGNTAANGSDPLPKPYTSLTVEALSVSYNACGGFVQYSGLQNFLQETARLTLTKQ
jgi:hypothetical protein